MLMAVGVFVRHLGTLGIYFLVPSTKNGSSWFRYQKTKVKINTCLIKKNVLDDEVNYKEEIF